MSTSGGTVVLVTDFMKAVKDTLDAHDVYRIRVKDSVMKISDDMPVASLYYFTEKLFKEYRSFSYSRHIDSENESPMQVDVICCVEDFSDYDKDAKNEIVGKKYLHIKMENQMVLKRSIIPQAN